MDENGLGPELTAFVRQMKDRKEIEDCLHRYTRGIDRHDRELMLSAYHPDARDEHGVAEGLAADFCDWAIGWHREFQTKHQHIITNHCVELDGDTAHAESYYLFWGENRQGPPSLCFGRYIDRLEKRDGRWAIAHRVCVNEKTGLFMEADVPGQWRQALFSTGPSTRSRDDISYARPLVTGKITVSAEERP
jgi:ketosteroid isomerase-like protein